MKMSLDYSKTAVFYFLLPLFLWGQTGDTSASEPIMKDNGLNPGNHRRSMTVNGFQRQYIVHVPRGYPDDQPVPLLIMFHGGGGRAAAAMWETGWAAKADREGFLAVFLEGTPPDTSRPGRFLGNPQTWNDGSNRSLGAVEKNIDDISFVRIMIRNLQEEFLIDPKRIYATGFSNGASMAFRAARELPGMFAAIAPVAGADWLRGRPLRKPVSLLYITGSEDPLNPLEGGEVRIAGKSYGIKPPVSDMIGEWVSALHCMEESRLLHENDGIRLTAWVSCRDGSEVWLCVIHGHGHHWPGGKSLLPAGVAGDNSAAMNATELIWDFFKRHPLQ